MNLYLEATVSGITRQLTGESTRLHLPDVLSLDAGLRGMIIQQEESERIEPLVRQARLALVEQLRAEIEPAFETEATRLAERRAEIERQWSELQEAIDWAKKGEFQKLMTHPLRYIFKVTENPLSQQEAMLNRAGMIRDSAHTWEKDNQLYQRRRAELNRLVEQLTNQ